jgi:hypothetical protein
MSMLMARLFGRALRQQPDVEQRVLVTPFPIWKCLQSSSRTLSRISKREIARAVLGAPLRDAPMQAVTDSFRGGGHGSSLTDHNVEMEMPAHGRGGVSCLRCEVGV